MIFVTGASGMVGSALLERLVADGVAVRALAHSRSGRAIIEGAGAEAVDGDFDATHPLEALIAGCDRLFLLSPTHPDLARREMAVIEAANRAAVTHVVKLSVLGASRSSSIPFARWHAEVEDRLIASGLDYTIIRAAGFMQVHLLPSATLDDEGRWYGMTGDGASGWIDVGDVAETAAEVLRSPGHTGVTYEVTGPESLSVAEAAAELSDAIGRTVTYVDLPETEFRAGIAAWGLPDWLADCLVAFYKEIREGHLATVTSSVQAITGRLPRSYRHLARDQRGAFSH